MFKLIIDDEAQAALANDGGQPLRDLCRQEVDSFDRHLRDYGREYTGGLSKFERWILEGYLYQKYRGRVDEAAVRIMRGG